MLECQPTAMSEQAKLRAELKEWERSFATTHDGRKAGREDIKQHPEIGITFKLQFLILLPAE